MRSLLAAAMSVLAASVHADILNVPGEFPTIQAALDAAQDGDEIVLAAGRHEIASTLIEPAVPIALVIRSTDPADPAVRDATVLVRPADQPAFILTITPSLVFRGLTFESASDSAAFLHASYLGDGLGDGRFRVEFDRCASTGVRASDFAALDVDLIGDPLTHSIDLRVLSCDFDQAWSGMRSAQGTAFVRDTSMNQSKGGIIAFRGIDAADSTFERVRGDVFRGGSNGGVSTIADCVFMDNDGRAIDMGGELTVSRISVTGGAGIALSSAGPFRVSDSTFTDVSGSAIEGNDPIVQRCTFTGGDASFGAVHSFGSGTLIEDCDFIGNWGSFASAIEMHLPLDDGTTVVRRSRFIGNSPREFDGFNTATIQVLGTGPRDPESSLIVEDCLFANNTAARGGVFTMTARRLGGQILFRRSTFAGNRADDGAVYWNGRELGPLLDTRAGIDRVVEFEGCLFVGNTAERNPIAQGAATFTGCTIVENVAQIDGTLGIGTFAFRDSIFVPDDPAKPVLGTPGSGDFVPTLTAASSVVPPSVQGTNITSLDPLFIRPPTDGGDGWGDDPTTLDIDESLNDDFGDLRLLPASPAIDAGTNDFFTPGDVDLDGNPRLADDPGIPGANVDIGAYEFQGTTCLADVNQDGSITPNDFNAWILAFNANSPLADQNRDGEVRQNDFNAWILNFNAGCPG